MAEWVNILIIVEHDHGGHGQWKVVTARYDPLRGRRIVRGRESECEAYYARQAEKEQAGKSGGYLSPISAE